MNRDVYIKNAIRSIIIPNNIHDVSIFDEAEPYNFP